MTTTSKQIALTEVDSFIGRHIGPSPDDVRSMLSTLGFGTIDEFIDATIPDSIRFRRTLVVGEPRTELDVLTEMRAIASRNRVFRSYLGMGYADCVTPSVIQRNIFENPGWYTAYTPYQAEIAQGRLEALLNFQTMVVSLTGLPIANASLLDEATAAAEAMHMFFAGRHDVAHSNKFFVDKRCFSQTIEVLKTRSAPLGIKLVIDDYNSFVPDNTFFGALLQYPDANGEIHDYTEWVSFAKKNNVRIAVAADILSLVLLVPPGEWGADIVVGSTQRFGVPIGYGGPHAAYIGASEEFKRLMPGRIIGVSKDAQGNRALRMSLQTREQHIRRDKATSNICTAQVLLAVMAGMYGVYHGPEGLAAIATRVHGLTMTLARGLGKLG